ncbi:hypothetical protein [Rubritalea profundi]|uniref:hypothetical protein n=1 Tax=Rubritalea profundi TaxID=1658618 RepID=UPI00101ADBBD|nr:hypothetical protein [Rubritalea profundi]
MAKTGKALHHSGLAGQAELMESCLTMQGNGGRIALQATLNRQLGGRRVTTRVYRLGGFDEFVGRRLFGEAEVLEPCSCRSLARFWSVWRRAFSR